MIVNHLENLNNLCTKTGLIRSLRKFYNSLPSHKTYEVYDSTPTTFVVLSSCQDHEFSKFAQRFRELESHFYSNERIPSKHCEKNMWLVKPAAENQGRGIQMFKNNFLDLKMFLQKKLGGTFWIIQKYIERPLLYYNRKFDIRMWAVITSKQEFYIYTPGYIRTSSDTYDTESKANYVHLTNNCLQQYGNKYGIFEDGNTVSFGRFANYLEEKYPDKKINFETDLLSRMKDLMIDTYLATIDDLNPRKRQNCFELLGYDFLIDEDFRVWLIEVNTNPYLGIPNKYIDWLLPKMINDLFDIVLDPSYKPANRVAQRDVENKFELLYSKKRDINVRRPYDIPLCPGEKKQNAEVKKSEKTNEKVIVIKKAPEKSIKKKDLSKTSIIEPAVVNQISFERPERNKEQKLNSYRTQEIAKEYKTSNVLLFKSTRH